MISHIIRAVAARLCSRCFYWKYQEEGQGRAVFLPQPGPEEEEEPCGSGDPTTGRVQGGRPRCEGLRLAVEAGGVWAVRCVPPVSSPSPSLLLPVDEDRHPQRKKR